MAFVGMFQNLEFHRVIVECAGNWKDGVNACPHAGAPQVVDVQTANVLYKYHA